MKREYDFSTANRAKDVPHLLRIRDAQIIQSRQYLEDLDDMRARGHQNVIDSMQQDFSQEWILAWCRIACSNPQDIKKFLKIASSNVFKNAAVKIDALILDNISQLANVTIAVRAQILLTTLAKGGKLPSPKDRDTLKERANIAKLIRKLATALDGDQELKTLDVRELHAVAVYPLTDYLTSVNGVPVYPERGFNRPEGDCKEIRSIFGFNRGPMLQEILNGIAKRIEAKKPFGMLQKPLPGTPNQNRVSAQKIDDDQRTLLERRLKEHFFEWFGIADADLITDLVGLAFERRVLKPERLLARDRIAHIK